LWDGCIKSRDGALQICLIVDSIFDWARDSYRPAVLNELKILAAPENTEIRSVFTDSDIYSSGLSIGETAEPDEAGSARSAVATFRALDSSNGIVRHVSLIESRFCALYITRDNLQTLVQSTDERMVQYVARQILKQLSEETLLLEADTFDAIEANWTGTGRFSMPFGIMQSKFYTVITFSTYLSELWEQVRELSVIGIAEDAFDSLVACSGLKPGRGTSRKPMAFSCDKSQVENIISRLRSGSMNYNLLAAISRTVLRIVRPKFLMSKDLHLLLDEGRLRTIVNSIYKSVKKGILEPTDPFIRVSNHLQQQSIGHPEGDPFSLSESLQVSDTAAVLINGDGPAYGVRQSQQSDECVYLVRDVVDVPDQVTLGTIIKATFESRDIYHTTRNNGTLNLKTVYRPSWNLEDTYGVGNLRVRNGFVRWIESLGSGLPTSQGSRRGSSNSGQDFWHRNFNPWSNPLIIYSNKRQAVKEFLRSMVHEEETFWEQEARNRKAQGKECCSKCAKLGHFDDDLCRNCLPDARRELALTGMSINSDSDPDHRLSSSLRESLGNAGIGIIYPERKKSQGMYRLWEDDNDDDSDDSDNDSDDDSDDSKRYSVEVVSRSDGDRHVIDGRPPGLEDLLDHSTTDQTPTTIDRPVKRRKVSENGVYQPLHNSEAEGGAEAEGSLPN
jgi:hypothetical protein